jgi:hypothetical protein
LSVLFILELLHGLLAFNGLPSCQPINYVVPAPTLQVELAAQVLALYIIPVPYRARIVFFRTALMPAQHSTVLFVWLMVGANLF